MTTPTITPFTSNTVLFQLVFLFAFAPSLSWADEVSDCPQGMERNEEHDQCCWPGQTWSSEEERCVGSPSSCPEGTVIAEEGCVECPLGEIERDGECVAAQFEDTNDGTLEMEQPEVMGALDKSVIDRVVKQHMDEVRFCYQRELNSNPTLRGKISVMFTIAADGTVSAASVRSSTLDNRVVENCIVGLVRRWRFPQPKGGGIVTVTYPFVFSP